MYATPSNSGCLSHSTPFRRPGYACNFRSSDTSARRELIASYDRSIGGILRPKFDLDVESQLMSNGSHNYMRNLIG